MYAHSEFDEMEKFDESRQNVHSKRTQKKDELENAIAAEIEFETMPTENEKIINVRRARNERNKDEKEEEKWDCIFYIGKSIHTNVSKLLNFMFREFRCVEERWNFSICTISKDTR